MSETEVTGQDFVPAEEPKKESKPNKPYRKAYDASGELINPLEGDYLSTGPNRRERRLEDGITSTRPFNNKKGIQLVTSLVGWGFKKKVIKFHKQVNQTQGGTRLQIMQKAKTK